PAKPRRRSRGCGLDAASSIGPRAATAPPRPARPRSARRTAPGRAARGGRRCSRADPWASTVSYLLLVTCDLPSHQQKVTSCNNELFPSRPLHAPAHELLVVRVGHGPGVVAEDVLDDAALAVVVDPDDRLVLAGALGLGGVGEGGHDHG